LDNRTQIDAGNSRGIRRAVSDRRYTNCGQAIYNLYRRAGVVGVAISSTTPNLTSSSVWRYFNWIDSHLWGNGRSQRSDYREVVGGSVLIAIAAIHSYPTLSYCLGTAILTAALIMGFFAFNAGRKRQQAKSRYISGKKGFVDFTDLGAAQRAFVEALEKIAQVHLELSDRIGSHTAAIERIKNGSGGNIAGEARKEASRAAKSTINAAAKLEKCIPLLTESVSVYFESQMGFVNYSDSANLVHKDQLRQLREQVEILRNSDTESREAQKNYLQSFEGCRGLSGAFDSALDRIVKEILEIVRVMDEVEICCDTVVSVIDWKLAGIVRSRQEP
jgi:hypothetical protein